MTGQQNGLALEVKKNECDLNGNSWKIETDKIKLMIHEKDGKIYFTSIDGIQVNVWKGDNIKSFKNTTGFFLGDFQT